MSLENLVEASDDCQQAPCHGVKVSINPKQKDLGAFSVRRLLPAAEQAKVGPWIFFDHMGPATFQPGNGINVRPHPHVNLATVTYLFEGEILHRDSLGYVQPIKPGDINLMVAGSGIVHSERERPEVTAIEHRLHGLQLWLALPEEDEETPPSFYHYPGAEIPTTEVDAVPVRIIMGQAYGKVSPVKTFAETLYYEAELQPGQRLTLELAEESAVYLAAGSGRIGGHDLKTYSLNVLDRSGTVTLATDEGTRIAVIGGEAMGKRFMYWNFASSSKERIEQAKSDWQQRRFDTIEGDSDEFIPLP